MTMHRPLPFEDSSLRPIFDSRWSIADLRGRPSGRVTNMLIKVRKIGANSNRINGLKSAPNKLLKIKRQNKKDVKNEERSQWFIESKGAGKVLPMSS
jgi:hypothetical protein